MYDVNLISLTLCEMWDKDLSHSSLQRLLYFSHVRKLLQTGNPLLKSIRRDESGSFCAWPFGAVQPNVYSDLSKKKSVYPVLKEILIEDTLLSEDIGLLKEIHTTYKGYSEKELKDVFFDPSHPYYSPYHQVYREGFSEFIPDELILKERKRK